MRRMVGMRMAAMIIGIAVVLPAQAGDAAALPSPVSFANSMELGDIGQAAEWLAAGLPPDFMGSRIGSGLMIGAWEGNIELMRLFISHGADINRMNSHGETPLTLAAWRGKLDAVKWLVERGARINTPRPRQWSALHYAAFAGNAEVADYLMAQGADIDALSTNGSSVLMMAIYEGHDDLAKKLLEKGADRTPKNDWGDGALEWSMRYNRLGIAKMIANPEEYNLAVNQPKEKWGEAKRSFRMSKELESLLNMREKLVERGQSTDTIDQRIAAERMRIVRSEFDYQLPKRLQTVEISASRKKPQDQTTQVITDDSGKPVGYKAPPTTYFGTPRMPVMAPVKNY